MTWKVFRLKSFIYRIESTCTGGTNVNCVDGVCSVTCSGSGNNNNNNINGKSQSIGQCSCREGFTARFDKSGDLAECVK